MKKQQKKPTRITDLGCTENTVSTIVNALVDDAPIYWNSNLMSENFKNKYKCAADIQPDIKNMLSIGARKQRINGKDLIFVSGIESKYYSEEYESDIVKWNYYLYDYFINNQKQLDDLIFFHKVTNEIIELTGERTDGKKLADDLELYDLLHFIANPYHDFDFVYTHNYTEEAMPYSDTCQIVNRPDLNKLGIPENSYAKEKDGIVYIIFEYADKVIKYKVDYKVNWDFFFDYIEYTEVKE